jgi:1-acyl-sn-glycerol-3-phosphate acyltransferase
MAGAAPTEEVVAPAPRPPPPSRRPPEKPTIVYQIGRVICRVTCDRWFDLKVYGARHVPRSGGVLIVSNHQSYLDPVVLAVKLQRPLSFLAKSELFEHPSFSWLIRSLNAYPVRQGEGDVGAVKETIGRLKEGHALNLFPEGTRTPDGTIQPMQAGVGLIVRRAGVPVVPAVIHGSLEAWPKKKKLFHPHPIRVQYGPPMELKDLKASEIVRRIDVTLRRMFDELRGRNM